jgi:PIN domain nuclease of toxin-antitoxin system
MTQTISLLLDTHVFLWWQAGDPRLGGEVKERLADAPLVFVSAASAWEAAIKIALGRLRLPETVEEGVEEAGFSKLPVTFAHAERVAVLPRHHADPFDRLLIAQAQQEGLTLVTHDREFRRYEVELLLI